MTQKSKILTRDMNIYTAFEAETSEVVTKNAFIKLCEVRETIKDSIDNFDINSIEKEIGYFFEDEESRSELKDYFIHGIGYVVDDLLYGLIKKEVKTFQDKYLLIISHLTEDFFLDNEECMGREVIVKYCFSFLKDDDIEEFLFNHVAENYPLEFGAFIKAYYKAYQLKSVEYFILKMQELRIFDMEIESLIMDFETLYLLLHTNNKITFDTPFIQIDVNKSDKEILDTIHAVRKQKKSFNSNIDQERKKKRKKILNKVVRKKGITKGMKYANMLFTYDCLEFGLSEMYITEQIDAYFYDNEIDFTLKIDTYKDYKKEINSLINF